MRDIHAIPAYERDYKSKAAVLADWNAGKDFQDTLTGQYFSVRDFPAKYPPGYHPQIWVRYSRLSKIMRVL